MKVIILRRPTMRHLFTLFFILTFCVGSLFAQEQKSEKQKQDSVISTVSVNTLNTQLIKQNKDVKKHPVGVDQLRNIGYGYQKANEITGSVSTLKPKMNEMNGYTDIYQYLQGRVAGLTVSGTSIRIRGIHTLTGSNEPLVVLNGVPLNGSSDLQFINPIDVKSIDVLKGANAAIYGTRGANGVILITTK